MGTKVYPPKVANGHRHLGDGKGHHFGKGDLVRVTLRSKVSVCMSQSWEGPNLKILVWRRGEIAWSCPAPAIFEVDEEMGWLTELSLESQATYTWCLSPEDVP